MDYWDPDGRWAEWMRRGVMKEWREGRGRYTKRRQEMGRGFCGEVGRVLVTACKALLASAKAIMEGQSL